MIYFPPIDIIHICPLVLCSGVLGVFPQVKLQSCLLSKTLVQKLASVLDGFLGVGSTIATDKFHEDTIIATEDWTSPHPGWRTFGN
jgi:hypothetical protein